VKIKETTPGLFLFQFAHALDMEAVLHGGPWSFNNQMLILERVGLGVQIENIPLYHVDFWVQVHNLPTGLMAERVGKTLANYIGSFVEYDKNNKGSFWREYMRIKVRVDIRQPLKKESRVKNQGGAWCTVHFKYEKLGVFCFVCGIMGHRENRYAVRFAMENDDGSRGWSKDLRAEPRRRGGRQFSKWLMEEGDNKSGPLDGQSQAHVDEEEQVHPTHPNNHSSFPYPNRPLINQQSLLGPSLVPLPNLNRRDLQLSNPSQPITCPVSASFTESNESSNLTIIQIENHRINPANQLSIAFNDPDKSLNKQLFPSNSQPIPSLTLSPILSETLNHKNANQFTFNANLEPTHKKQQLPPVLRLPKSNPNQKSTRTGPQKNGPKIDPPRPVSNPTQNSTLPMETQTEKKRRREEEKEPSHTATVTQHFLTAGPGSQACWDQ
jgi:14-3-3 protein epsilon